MHISKQCSNLIITFKPTTFFASVILFQNVCTWANKKSRTFDIALLLNIISLLNLVNIFYQNFKQCKITTFIIIFFYQSCKNEVSVHGKNLCFINNNLHNIKRNISLKPNYSDTSRQVLSRHSMYQIVMGYNVFYYLIKGMLLF